MAAGAPGSNGIRVLITSRVFSPEPTAASFRLAAVLEALVADGCQVEVLTTKPNPQSALIDRKLPGTVRRWNALRDGSGYVRGYVPYMSFDIPLLFRALFSKRPNVALVEPPPTTGTVMRVVSALRLVPYVWYAADLWADATESVNTPVLVTSVVRTLERFAIRGASGVIAINEEIAERVSAEGARNVKVVPNGVDTDVYTPTTPPLTEAELADLGITSPYLVYAGTASEWQGAVIFAEAMAGVLQDVDCQLVFVGQGTEFEVIERIGADVDGSVAQPRIVTLPPQTPDQVAQIIAGSKGAMVSIKPGIGYDFAYPTKVLAGLAVGKPVLYVGPGPARQDIIQNDLGVVANYDVIDVGRGITDLITAPQGRFEPNRLHDWVVQNRSLRAVGSQVADFLLSVARKNRRR